jgi:protein-disulfide isomerase
MDRLIALAALACAMTAVALLMWRTFGTTTDPEPPRSGLRLDTLRVASTSTLVAEGHWWGVESARDTVLVFTDFECPACRDFHLRALRGAMQVHRDDLAVGIRHWPLRSHRLAVPMAIAAECAGAQGQFWAFQEYAFEQQDSIGLVSFDDFAQRAGVADLEQFQRCRSEPGIRAKVERSAVVAESLGGRGTPLVIVNGLAILRGIDSLGLDKLLGAGPALSR